jgi:hypothetical protein
MWQPRRHPRQQAALRQCRAERGRRAVHRRRGLVDRSALAPANRRAAPGDWHRLLSIAPSLPQRAVEAGSAVVARLNRLLENAVWPNRASEDG